MASLNLDYYNGKDSYSDGDVEDIIYHIVEKCEDFTKYKGTDEFFPILYHLSPERENILNWYPFNKKDKVLEIGSGCGAITGALCRLCGNVTCIELSKKRSRINYMRNEGCNNLEIIVGNFNDINLMRQYDYVVLNGVFEYAMSFFESDIPYEDFLLKVRQFLKESGKILIAIENRIGVKYLAGDAEDHTNCSFVGLNNYIGNDTVRTFSKTELEELFGKCGINYWNYYYPYPDYKFPTEIFTDENINGEGYGKAYRKYFGQYMNAFDEIAMISTLKKEGVMDKFANSFLVEICLKKESDDRERIEYVKLNNYRKEKFRIATAILNNQGIKTVKKYALNDMALKHIDNIYHNQFFEIGNCFSYNQGIKENGEIIYPFLLGSTLDMEVAELILAGKISDVTELIDTIYYSLLGNSQEVSDIYCENFILLFGNQRLSTNEKCLLNCNVDLILMNLFRKDGNIVVIDPEWVFPFAIPVKFVVWRIINECYAMHPKIENLLSLEDFLERYEISADMAGVFYAWAVSFATQYVSNIDLDDFVPNINKMDQTYKTARSSLEIMKSSLYIDYGTGYSESDKKIIYSVVNENRFESKILLDKNRMIYKLRWDPVEMEYCNCHVDGCTLDGKIVKVIPVNSSKEHSDLFLNLDPQFDMLIEPGHYAFFKITGTFSNIGGKFLDHMINNISESLSQSENTNRDLKEENTLLKDSNILLEEENKKISVDYRKLEQDKVLSDEQIVRLKKENSEINQKKYAFCMESEVLAQELKKKNIELHLMEDNYKKIQTELTDISVLNKNLSVELVKISDELHLVKESRIWKLREKINGIFRSKGNNE